MKITKKRQPLLWYILIPVLLTLILIPPLCCLVFWHFSNQFSHYAASNELGKIKEPMTALIRDTFSTELEGIGAEARKKQVRDFLLQAQTIIDESGANVELIIFESQGKSVYPKNEEKLEYLQPLIEGCQDLQNRDFSDNRLSEAAIKTETGTYLTDFYKIPIQLPQISYVVVGCSMTRLTLWMRPAMCWIFLLSSVLVGLCFVSVWLIAKQITSPLQQLCQAAKNIGSGDFAEIQMACPMQELEELRVEMNGMIRQLKHSGEIQKDFFQNISHELRNPLMSISGYAQGIEHGIFKDPQSAAHTILEESARLTELVSSLLTLSRIECRTSEQTMNLSVIPIDEILEDCLDRVSGLAIKKKIPIRIVPYQEDEAVLGDGELICKVLENFLTNALRYARSEVVIRVLPKKDQTSISVEDDGEGIAAKDLSHLFERCYKGKGGNFGIGLAIASSAAERMQGTVKGENRPEGGAVFTLTLQRSS